MNNTDSFSNLVITLVVAICVAGVIAYVRVLFN